MNTLIVNLQQTMTSLEIAEHGSHPKDGASMEESM